MEFECYTIAYREEKGGNMEKYVHFTKEDVMNLNTTDLLQYVNYMLSVGYTMQQLNDKKGIRRQTIRDRLKKAGYVFDKDQNQYVATDKEELPLIVEEVKHTESQIIHKKITLEEVYKVLQSLESRITTLEETRGVVKREQVPQNQLKVGGLELIPFHSKAVNRNYPLYPEVYERLDRLKEENPHLKIKEIINSLLYKALLDLEDN